MKKKAKQLTEELDITPERRKQLEATTKTAVSMADSLSEALLAISLTVDTTDLEKVLMGYALGASNNKLNKN